MMVGMGEVEMRDVNVNNNAGGRKEKMKREENGMGVEDRKGEMMEGVERGGV